MKRFFTLSEVLMTVMLMAFSCHPAMAQHYMTLTWPKVANPVGGAYLNLYRGTTAGGESVTPINSSHIDVAQITYQDNNVASNTKYFYVLKQCAVDLSTTTEVCSAPSPEASATIGLAPADLTTPGVITATPH